MISIDQLLKNTLDSAINSRYMVLLISIAFFLFLVFAFFLLIQNANVMRAQINVDFNQQQLILARQTASQLSANLNNIVMDLKWFEHLWPLKLDRESQYEIMRAMAKRDRPYGIIEIGLAGMDGKVIERIVEQTNGNTEKTGSATIEFLEEDVLSPLHFESNSETGIQVTCTYHVNVTIRDTESLIIYIKIDVSKLAANVAGKIRSGKTGYAWIIDENGDFLYHPEKEFIGKNAFTVRQERGAYISFKEINRIMQEKMLQGKEGAGSYVSGWHRGIYGKMSKLIAYTPVTSSVLSPRRPWSVAVAAPVSEVEETVRNIYMRHFVVEAVLVAVLFLFGLVAITYYYQRSMTLKQQINEQESYLSSILHNSLDAIVFIDTQNRIKVWNRGAAKIFGYTAEEMLGTTFHCLIPPELNAEEELARITKQAEESNYISIPRAHRITKDGRRISVDLSRTVMRSEDNTIIGSTVIFRDVTDKIEFEQRLYNTEKLASIGTLAAGVAHEINNPLTIILGFTDFLLERFEPETPVYEDLKLIEENAENARKIVQNLLGFARVTEGLEHSVDVVHSLRTVINIVQNMLMNKKIKFVENIAPELSRVRGDAREFQQVLFNLINNSIAAMDPGEGTLSIKAVEEGFWIYVRVSDTGVGIPDKIKPMIFDPFFTTKKVGEGTGLGLSLCYGIVKKYGGNLSFSSISKEDHPDEMSGTTFTVSMPVQSIHGSPTGGEHETENFSG